MHFLIWSVCYVFFFLFLCVMLLLITALCAVSQKKTNVSVVPYEEAAHSVNAKQYSKVVQIKGQNTALNCQNKQTQSIFLDLIAYFGSSTDCGQLAYICYKVCSSLLAVPAWHQAARLGEKTSPTATNTNIENYSRLQHISSSYSLPKKKRLSYDMSPGRNTLYICTFLTVRILVYLKRYEFSQSPFSPQ